MQHMTFLPMRGHSDEPLWEPMQAAADPATAQVWALHIDGLTAHERIRAIISLQINDLIHPLLMPAYTISGDRGWHSEGETSADGGSLHLFICAPDPVRADEAAGQVIQACRFDSDPDWSLTTAGDWSLHV